jgi:hemolysin activation/secretion protein
LQPYQCKAISAEQLQEARTLLTHYYIDAGYINSGAIIPDQKVENGEIILKIIEGRLSELTVSGHERLKSDYIHSRLALAENEVLNIHKLQEKLQLLQQNPLLQRINAELVPGVSLGEGILNVNIKENRPYQFTARINNHRSPNIGSYRGELEGIHRNITGWGDRLYARYGLTEGLNDYALEYAVPLNSKETTLGFYLERSDSRVIDEPFSQLKVESRANTYALHLQHPFYRTSNRTLNLGLKLERRESQTFLLGRPYPFSSGVGYDGKSEIAVLRFSQDWLDRSRTQVIAARSSFNFGLDAFGATINHDNSPDSRFFTWLGQFQWVRRLDLLESQILFRTDVQLANQGLLPLEKFSVGGASSVRGYRENELTRDNGLITSLEWRVPLMRLRVPYLSQETDDGLLQLAPFFDYGRAWNSGNETLFPKSISSVGLGLRWSPSQKIWGEVYWGKPLRDLPGLGDLQDKGWHFEFNFQL